MVVSGLKQNEPVGDKGSYYKSYFLNGKLNEQLSSGFSFCAPRSLAIQMIGTYNITSGLYSVRLCFEGTNVGFSD